ncbi:histidine kinase [Micromonospora halotolerans]|uniref:Histidine kinase n=1 Tax=Micromonospora halotolerans TaxID=709879 RepID=A0ABY9ZVX8_9ACTN|nr:histidine kinase [Micromonospora halotolerans]WNM39175.1 histidine kinase [Micromonospora halotolerans]
MVDRPARVGALWSGVVVLAVVALALRRQAPAGPFWSDIGFTLGVPLAVASVGALVLARRPGHPVGPLLTASAAAMVAADAASAYAAVADGAVGVAAAWAGAVLAPVGVGLLILSMLLIPDGRLPSRRWRPVLAGGAGLLAVKGVVTAFAPGELAGGSGVDNPLDIDALAAPAAVVAAVEPPVTAALVLAAAVSVLVRHRRGDAEQRRRLSWVVAAALVFIGVLAAHPVAGALGVPLPGWLADVLFLVAVVTFPVALGVAILRHRLFDIEAVLGAALVYGALTALLTALYVAVVSYVGAILGAEAGRLGGLVATAGVAVAFAPLRDRLEAAVDRLLHGGRRDPYGTLTQIGRRLGKAAEPEADLHSVVTAIADGLRLPYARLALSGPDGEVTREAEHGVARHGRYPIELIHGGRPMGLLELGPRGPGEAFTESERRLLAELGRQVAVAAHAAQLAEEVRASRERLVLSREEERRRLRRDLHDGTGPRLAALVLRLETAQARFASQPAVVAALADLAALAREAVSDVRRVVRGLRPPSLDELGLVGALREVAARHSHDGLTVQLIGDPPVGRLPAAVEAAAYRITDEAVTNAARHATARTCAIRLTTEPAGLVVQVDDDGVGLAEDRPAGVGLISMRERAEELGGTFAVTAGAEGGTSVRACLPVDRGWAVAG